jgi:putative tryptophan/tyrosine transport system substrate-binding protein
VQSNRSSALAIAALGCWAMLGGSGGLLLSVPARGEPAAVISNRPARIGLLLYNSRPQYPSEEHPFFIGLRDIGLVDGRNVTVLVREAEGHVERLPQLGAELVAAKPDIIVTAGPQPIRAMKDATSSIPIVMAIVSDPVTYGFAASLAHPGGNLTGMSMVNTELSSKRLQLLKEATPGISRVAVLTDPTMGPQGLPETESAARALGLELQILTVTAGQINHGFGEAERGRAEALLVMPTPFYNLPEVRSRIGEVAVRYRLPSMCEEISYVRDGCLLSYGPDFAAMWRHSATYVDKILRGGSPGDLPIEQPTRFNLFVNLNTAKALGLRIPQTLLIRVDEVVQ